MSESAYKAHPIWSTIKTLDDLLTNEAFFQPELTANEQATFERDKVIAITKLIHANLEQTPAILVSMHGLTQLNTSVQSSVTTQIAAYITGKNLGHITGAANFIDQSIYSLLGICFPKFQDSGEKALTDTFDAIRSSSLKAIQQLNSEESKLVEKISLQKLEVANIQSQINTFAEIILVQKSEAMSVTAQVQKEFADSEAKRLIEFTNNIDEFKKSFNDHESKSKSAAADLIGKIEKNRNDGANLLKALGDDSVTGNYRIIAKNETDQANTWRRVTFGLFALGIIIALCTFWKFLDQPFSPENAWSSFIRLLYAIVITTPAWYAAKESARHRNNADRARQTELELASLGPFIELMPEDKKTLIREELIKTYFGNKVDKHEVAAPIQIKDAADLITAIKGVVK